MKKNASRISKTLFYLKNLVDNTKKQCNIGEDENFRKQPKFKSSILKLAKELHNAEVFVKMNGREFPSFPKFEQSILSKIDTDKFCQWVKEKQLEFTQTQYN